MYATTCCVYGGDFKTLFVIRETSEFTNLICYACKIIRKMQSWNLKCCTYIRVNTAFFKKNIFTIAISKIYNKKNCIHKQKVFLKHSKYSIIFFFFFSGRSGALKIIIGTSYESEFYLKYGTDHFRLQVYYSMNQ